MFNEVRAWNTWRDYGVHGQRIAAGMLSDGTILFADADREIWGVLRAKASGLNKHDILRLYDEGRYNEGDDFDDEFFNVLLDIAKSL